MIFVLVYSTEKISIVTVQHLPDLLSESNITVKLVYLGLF